MTIPTDEERAAFCRRIVKEVTGLDPDKRGDPRTWTQYQQTRWLVAARAVSHTFDALATKGRGTAREIAADLRASFIEEGICAPLVERIAAHIHRTMGEGMTKARDYIPLDDVYRKSASGKNESETDALARIESLLVALSDQADRIEGLLTGSVED